MAKDLRYLGNIMPKYAQALSDDAAEYQHNIALAVLAAVAKGTPVDVGTARSNWQLTLGNIATGLRAAFSPYESRWRGGQGGSISETQNQAGVVWQAASLLKGRKDDQPIYITNNSPYIEVLNQGHSKQAPAGFIEAGIQSGTASVVTLFRFTNIEKLAK
jgi:hypothetical protein